MLCNFPNCQNSIEYTQSDKVNVDRENEETIEKKEFNLHEDHDSFFSTNYQQVKCD